MGGKDVAVNGMAAESELDGIVFWVWHGGRYRASAISSVWPDAMALSILLLLGVFRRPVFTGAGVFCTCCK